MPRVKRGVHAKKKRKKIFKLAAGSRGARSRLLRTATESVERGLVYAFAHRRRKKREQRSVWVARINAAARANGITYSRLISGLIKANVALDRKSLADMAANDPAAFAKVSSIAKQAVGA
ncbi:MAG: 50S ribosomal protein L20 [Deltaproteobacteria bacterium]|nr:50S ribosomal protein L20 [Deltaproteobacteria bacterium]